MRRFNTYSGRRRTSNTRDEYNLQTIQTVANTSVIKLRYRTPIESNWR